ncbi:MAG: hypothetical protein CMK43_08390 [Porticoccaceae bacterium]|nr:hypothetical protein [Porticoccaceae bacterium]
METVLGIDLGTQSIKLIFYDYKAKKIVSHSSAPLTVHRKVDGSAEQSVEQWLEGLKSCFFKIPKRSPRDCNCYRGIRPTAWARSPKRKE